MTTATGMGSWPGTDVREAVRTVRDLFADDLPWLPETPARGPGADLIGRSAALLVDLPVDLQPAGWRLVDRPGRDAARTASLWRRDLDELAEAFDGWAGDLKVQVCGPWTLAASLALTRGERAVVDAGAAKELVESLAEGIRGHLADVAGLVPGARLVLQLDEPSLPAVLEGSLPTASGYGRIRPVDPQTCADGLRTVLDAAAGRATLVHCCHPRVPVPLLRNAGAGGLAVDTGLLGPAAWESVAVCVESGMRLYAGCLATDGTGTRSAAVDALLRSWERTALPASALDAVVVSPGCGLAGLTPEGARAVSAVTIDIARDLTDRAHA